MDRNWTWEIIGLRNNSQNIFQKCPIIMKNMHIQVQTISYLGAMYQLHYVATTQLDQYYIATQQRKNNIYWTHMDVMTLQLQRSQIYSCRKAPTQLVLASTQASQLRSLIESKFLRGCAVLGCNMVGMHPCHALVGSVEPNPLVISILATWGAMYYCSYTTQLLRSQTSTTQLRSKEKTISIGHTWMS